MNKSSEEKNIKFNFNKKKTIDNKQKLDLNDKNARKSVLKKKKVKRQKAKIINLFLFLIANAIIIIIKSMINLRN